MDKNKFSSSFGFIDLLFNLLVGFVFLFFIAYILINPIAKKGIITPPDIALIVANWDNGSTSDVDIWIKDPVGNVMSFQNKVIPGMHLEKDDLGNRNDTVWVNGQEVVNETNQEVIHIQTLIPGTYRVTVHMYNIRNEEPQTVVVALKSIQPYKDLATQTVTLSSQGEEQGVFEFTVNEYSAISSVTSYHGSIVRSELERNYTEPRNSRDGRFWP